MGTGIALASAQNKFQTILFDINPGVIDKARDMVESNLEKLVSRQKISAADKNEISGRLVFTSSVADCKAELVIEAIVEKLTTKIDLLSSIASLNNKKTILASNTSSLSITKIQEALPNPGRVAGMHFFNPAHIMKLVEVVKGKFTDDDTLKAITAVCVAMKKTPVSCIDSPGFIVNRVARPFYLEAMKLVEDGNAEVADVDIALEACGFKMGPFTLMDLIGLDINLAVSQSVYAAYDNAPRFKPSSLQQQKVADGDLGRKTGRGFYSHNAS